MVNGVAYGGVEHSVGADKEEARIIDIGRVSSYGAEYEAQRCWLPWDSFEAVCSAERIVNLNHVRCDVANRTGAQGGTRVLQGARPVGKGDRRWEHDHYLGARAHTVLQDERNLIAGGFVDVG